MISEIIRYCLLNDMEFVYSPAEFSKDQSLDGFCPGLFNSVRLPFVSLQPKEWNSISFVDKVSAFVWHRSFFFVQPFKCLECFCCVPCTN